MITETPLHDQHTVREHLLFHRTVLLYFTDSEIPARVLNATGSSVYVQHGRRFFWQRINNANVARIVLYEFNSEVV